jgi:hypothetical protein
MRALLFGFQDFKEIRKSIPIASRNRAAKMFFDLAQESDGLHISPVQTEGKPTPNLDEPNQPILASREVNRECRGYARLLGENADKADYVRPGGFADKGPGRGQAKDVVGRADHHFSFEREPAKKLLAQLCLVVRFPNDKSSRSTDVHHAQFGHLTCEEAWAESPVSANVHTF